MKLSFIKTSIMPVPDEYIVSCITVENIDIIDNNAIAKAKNPQMDIPLDKTLRINAIIDIKGYVSEELKAHIAGKLALAIFNYQFNISKESLILTS